MTNDPNPVAPAQKSPLDVLEEILQQKGQPAAVPSAPQVDPAQQQAELEAAQMAEVHAMEAQKQAQDQAELAARQTELQQAKQTPAYQARVEQQSTEKQQSDAQTQAHAGYEITQLQHTKIQEVGDTPTQ